MEILKYRGLRKVSLKISYSIFLLAFLCACNKNILDEQTTIKHENISIPINGPLYSVYFLNLKTGFAGGNNGQIIKTNDGTGSWENISVPFNVRINCIRFFDETNGFIGTSDGIMKTTNGGKNWTSVLNACNVNTMFIKNFYTKIYAAGNIDEIGQIWESSDSGSNWYSLVLPTLPKKPQSLHAIQFLDKDTAFAGGNQYCLLRTVNGGKTWNYCNAFKNENITDFYFTSNAHGYICFDSGKLLEMTEFNKCIIINDGIMYPIYALDYNLEKGIAVGKNCVYRNLEDFNSEDKTWSYMLTSEGISFNKTYYDICFASASIAYAVGENGLLSRFIISD